MGLLGDIRYMLTQSHYKRTTPYVSVCVCVHAGVCVLCVQAQTLQYVFDQSLETRGWYVCFCVRQYCTSCPCMCINRLPPMSIFITD